MFGQGDYPNIFPALVIFGAFLGAVGVGLLWLVIRFSPVVLAWRHG